MRKISTAIFFVLLCLSGTWAWAQPTLTQASVGSIGSTYYMGVLDTFVQPINEGPSGANRSWDFASIGFTDFDTLWFENPAGTPYATSFSGSNLAIRQASLQGGYAYMNSTSAFLDLLGVAGDILGTGSPVVVQQNPALRIAAFPTTYGNSFNGGSVIDERIDASSFGIPFVDSARFKNVQDRMVLADAWGTINIPDASYPNALRVKQVISQWDSIWIHSAFTGWTLFQDSSYTDSTFTWWDETKGYFLLELEYAGPDVAQITYQDPLVVGRPELRTDLLRMYPNPASTTLRLEGLKEAGTFSIFDVQGKLLKEMQLSPGQHELSVGDLANGQYFVRFLSRQGKQLQMEKLSIQR